MYDLEIEKAMLCHIIYKEYDTDLTENDFIDAKNKAIIKAVNELKKSKEDISMLSVKSKMKGDTTRILTYLSTLTDYAIGTNPDDLYNRLVELSQKRAVFDLLKQKILDFEDISIQDIINDMEKQINKIMQRNTKEETFVEQLVKTATELEEKYKNRNDYSLYTGLSDIDDKILGFHNSELTIIGARPRCWKNNICITDSTENSRK